MTEKVDSLLFSACLGLSFQMENHAENSGHIDEHINLFPIH